MTDHDLANFLDAHANDMRAWPDDEPKFRLAATRLRHLDALLTAIGDLSTGWTVREGGEILRRIADAADNSED